MNRYPSQQGGRVVQQPQQYQGRDQENIHELIQLFPNVDKNSVVKVYESKGRNFEATFKELDRFVKYNQELNALAMVPPERKLAFLRLAFDKIDPNFIQAVLQRYQWSVEAALDDILKAEEQRLRILEEQRRREEEERLRREEAERAALAAQRVEVERQNQVLFFQSMFPMLPMQLIAAELVRSGFNPDIAINALSDHENRRAAQEAAMAREREEQIRREQEARRQAELRQIEEQLQAQNAPQIQALTQDLLQCQNWDQVAQMVLQVPEAQQPEAARLADEENQARLNAFVKANPRIDPKVVAKIARDNNFDVDASLVLLRAQEFNEALQNMLTVFPDLPKEQVQESLAAYFPESGKAMQELQPIANDMAEEKLLQQAVQNEHKFLMESKQNLAQWEEEKALMMARRAKRKQEVANASPQELAFMQMVDEMQTQKEDLELKQNDQKLKTDVANHEAKFLEAQRKLEQFLQDKQKRSSYQHAQRMARPAARDDMAARRAEFDTLFAAELDTIHQNREKVANQRQSLVANRLRGQIGEERFAELQKAIGRAPGGVPVGLPASSSRDNLAGVIAAQVRERSRQSLGAQAVPAPAPAPAVAPVAVSASTVKVEPPKNPISPQQPAHQQIQQQLQQQQQQQLARSLSATNPFLQAPQAGVPAQQQPQQLPGLPQIQQSMNQMQISQPGPQPQPEYQAQPQLRPAGPPYLQQPNVHPQYLPVPNVPAQPQFQQPMPQPASINGPQPGMSPNGPSTNPSMASSWMQPHGYQPQPPQMMFSQAYPTAAPAYSPYPGPQQGPMYTQHPYMGQPQPQPGYQPYPQGYPGYQYPGNYGSMPAPGQPMSQPQQPQMQQTQQNQQPFVCSSHSYPGQVPPPSNPK